MSMWQCFYLEAVSFILSLDLSTKNWPSFQTFRFSLSKWAEIDIVKHSAYVP